MRTPLIILIVILLATSAFIAGYYLSGKNSNAPSLLSSDMLSKFEIISGNILSTMSDSNQPISSAKATSLTLSSNIDSVLYYEKNTGRVINLNYKTGSDSVVSSNNLPNFISTVWSPNNTEVISSFYEPLGNIYKYYNFKTKKSISLLRTIKSVAFSPDGKYIVYFAEGDDNSSLVISYPDGSNPKKLLSTRMANVKLFWPSADSIYVQASNESDNAESLFKINLNGNLTKIIDGGIDMQLKFSKSGKNILFSYIYNDERLAGLILGHNSEQYIENGIRANECAWSIDDETIFCAMSTSTGSNIKSFNIITKTLNQVVPMPFNGPTESILLSPAEDYLILHNKNDGKIYVIKHTAL